MDAGESRQHRQAYRFAIAGMDKVGQCFGALHGNTGGRCRAPSGKVMIVVGSIENETPYSELDFVEDQPTPSHVPVPPVGHPLRQEHGVGGVGADIGRKPSLHDRLPHITLDRQTQEIDERKIDADEWRTRGDRNRSVRNGGPEQHQSPRFHLLLPSVENIGHLPFHEEVQLDMAVPMRSAHGIGDVPLDQKAAGGCDESFALDGIARFRHGTIW